MRGSWWCASERVIAAIQAGPPQSRPLRTWDRLSASAPALPSTAGRNSDTAIRIARSLRTPIVSTPTLYLIRPKGCHVARKWRNALLLSPSEAFRCVSALQVGTAG